jgi:two-component system alkaline phosphatase synthesis response regulator PhoP
MGKKILIVDDDQDIVSAIETILRLEDYKTITAYTGEDSILRAKEEKPSLILLDYMLPDMTGRQVVEKIRKDQEVGEIPIILVSATHGLKQLCQGVPIQAIIEKPFDLEILTATVAKFTSSN